MARRGGSAHAAASWVHGVARAGWWRARAGSSAARTPPVDNIDSSRARSTRVSVVIPVRNEAANLGPLITEIGAALGSAPDWEIVCVDDGSEDGTPALLAEIASAPGGRVRAFRHDVGRGQSAAIVTGVRCAHGNYVVTIDGDGQNDPADIPRLVALLADADRSDVARPILVAGRRARRRDSAFKRVSSRIANAVRSRILRDATSDTGCGLKAFRRTDFLALPHFDHLHRFLPALFIRQRGRVVAVDVNHRERRGGRSNYGVLDRLGVGVVDLLGVWWLMRRPCAPVFTRIEPPATDVAPSIEAIH